jgi:hypothetical protein
MRAHAWRVIALLLLATSPASAQSAEDLLGRYIGDNAQGYLGPLADFLGASLNSGWSHSASVPSGVHIRLDLVGAGALIGDAQRTFQATTEGSFTPRTTAAAPTIFGSGQPVVVNGQGGTAYVFPGGIPAKMVALAVPQLTLGTVAGTMVSVRWFGIDINDDLGRVSMLGLGAQHDIGRYFSDLPLDLSVAGSWQSLELGDVAKTSGMVVSVLGGKRFSVLGLYGALGYENASTELDIEREGSTEVTRIELDAANTVRVTAGFALHLKVIELFADYTLASQKAFTVGLGLGR